MASCSSVYLLIHEHSKNCEEGIDFFFFFLLCSIFLFDIVKEER